MSKNLLLISILLISNQVFAATYCKKFNQCLSKAGSNLNKKGGREYYLKAAKHFFNMAEQTLTLCATEKTKEQSYVLLYYLADSGKQLYSSVKPKTEYTLCVVESAKDIVFPAPPRPGYWLHLNMGYNPKPTDGE